MRLSQNQWDKSIHGYVFTDFNRYDGFDMPETKLEMANKRLPVPANEGGWQLKKMDFCTQSCVNRTDCMGVWMKTIVRSRWLGLTKKEELTVDDDLKIGGPNSGCRLILGPLMDFAENTKTAFRFLSADQENTTMPPATEATAPAEPTEPAETTEPPKVTQGVDDSGPKPLSPAEIAALRERKPTVVKRHNGKRRLNFAKDRVLMLKRGFALLCSDAYVAPGTVRTAEEDPTCLKPYIAKDPKAVVMNTFEKSSGATLPPIRFGLAFHRQNLEVGLCSSSWAKEGSDWVLRRPCQDQDNNGWLENEK